MLLMILMMKMKMMVMVVEASEENGNVIEKMKKIVWLFYYVTVPKTFLWEVHILYGNTRK